jgi:predicted RNase H-related nuclease YkuK (DUF458 family)
MKDRRFFYRNILRVDCSFGIHKKFRIAVGAVADCEIHSHISIAQLHLLLATAASQWTCRALAHSIDRREVVVHVDTEPQISV